MQHFKIKFLLTEVNVLNNPLLPVLNRVIESDSKLFSVVYDSVCNTDKNIPHKSSFSLSNNKILPL